MCCVAARRQESATTLSYVCQLPAKAKTRLAEGRGRGASCVETENVRVSRPSYYPQRCFTERYGFLLYCSHYAATEKTPSQAERKDAASLPPELSRIPFLPPNHILPVVNVVLKRVKLPAQVGNVHRHLLGPAEDIGQEQNEPFDIKFDGVLGINAYLSLLGVGIRWVRTGAQRDLSDGRRECARGAGQAGGSGGRRGLVYAGMVLGPTDNDTKGSHNLGHGRSSTGKRD